MLSCHIVFILWTLATTVVTTPSDNVRQIDNDENLPRYLYKYSIENDDGAEQGKIETRSGELASGQYYINNNQSLTDVKYFADKWGYHPVVKYSTSNGRNATSSAHLAFDNHPIYELYNNTTDGKRIKSSTNIESNIPSEFESVGNFKPPISDNANLYKQSVNNIGLTNDTSFERQQTEDNLNKYEIMKQLLNINDSADQNGTPINYSTANLDDEGIQNSQSTIIENVLLGESTAGIFGQRVNHIIQQFNNSDKINSELPYAPIPLTHDDSIQINPETSSSNYKHALDNLRKYLRLYNNDDLQSFEEDEVNSQIILPIPLNNTETPSENLLNEAKSDLEIKFLNEETSLNPKSGVTFSRPIVVAEISNTERHNYTSILPCNEDNVELISSHTIDTDSLSVNTEKSTLIEVTSTLTGTPEFQHQTHATTSSIVLNPIQAGVALVNAGKTHLIDGNEEPSLAVPVNENRFNENAPIDTNQPLKNIEYDVTSQLLNIPSTINLTFVKLESSTMNSPVSLATDDDTVEIQKSLELYHSSPVQEIHYPAQLTPQVTSIDQQQLQEPYQSTQKHENAKQTFERNVESYKEDIDLTLRKSNTLKYQSIANPSTLLLQELQTTPEGNDPTPTHLTDNRKNVYDNNVEHLNRPVESYNIQDDYLSISTQRDNPSDNKNIFVNAKLINSELNLPYETKNSYSIVEPNKSSDIITDKSIKHDTSIITMEVPPRTQSILQRLLSESSDVVHHLEVDKLNNHDKQLHQRHPPSANELRIASGPDYTGTEINLTQQQIPIFTGEQYTDTTNIIDNTITPIQTQTSANNGLTSDINNNTVYIYTRKINNEINNIRNYGQSLNNPVGKIYDNSFIRPSYARPFSYPFTTNRIIEKHVPYVLQPYPIASAEKIIEKKMVPYPIHKLVAQPYPIHILQQYTLDKSQNVPAITYENIITKNGHIPHGYPIEIPIKISYPFELQKNNGKSIQIPYGVHYGLNYQHIGEQFNHKLYGKHSINSLDLPFSANMSNQNSRSYIYVKPVIPFVNLPTALSKRYSSLNQFANSKQYYPRQQSLQYQPSLKKSYSSQLAFQTHTTTNTENPTPLRWHVTNNIGEKFMNNIGYLDSVSLAPQHALNVQQQNQVVHPAHHETFRYSTGASIPVGSSLRRTKLPETHYHGNTGNFRQSKMEYGFKPPMVPSIQYDEQTATKVDN